jgi:hypothetical protein
VKNDEEVVLKVKNHEAYENKKSTPNDNRKRNINIVELFQAHK